MSRIVPLEPPYDDRTGPLLESLMPAGVPPIGLFRTFALNPVMTEAMAGWYHAICYAANGAGVELEPDAPRFADYQDEAPAAG